MFGSEILDVVIGMIFIFLLLSLVCTAINEMIEAVLNKRAKFLEAGIKELLNDRSGTGLVAAIYNHPLIAGLFRGSYGTDATLPSYIPARNFALALMDTVLPGVNNPQSGTDSATARTNVAGSAADATGATNSLQTLREAINNNRLIDPETQKALTTLIDAAGNDAAKARENIENWFNSSMDRVSGWYKRRAQVIILILGLLTAIGINADSITISNSLSHDNALRESLVTAADEYAKMNASPAASPKPSPSPDSNSRIVACQKDATSPECKFETSLGQIKGLGLPIGWDRNNTKLVPASGDIGGWMLKIFGWLITAFAISLGAPFWFDLLNKFMVVRSTVKPREKSPEEPSKD
ncbi:MAG: hypothetical protein M3384_19785 [Acidobacteriota bacterium]|nr:hypothetical protein [Acidobacteriota bacterium]